MQSNTFAIYTLGCKVNTFESNSMRNQLLMNGYIEKPFNSFSDIYIINTCTVTEKADKKSINIIKRAKKNNPNSIVIASGCYTQINSNIGEKYDIDILIGNKYKNNVYELILEFEKKKKRINKIENLLINQKFEKNEDINFTNQTRAFIKIQDGCNFMCSYCIIPFSRGRQRSKNLNILIEEINKLKEKYKEIVITGVNTAGYDDGKNNFEKLLEEINKIKGDFRIRISSVEPFQITDRIVEIITNNPKRFCQQWHICLQSGSNKVLMEMNRKYSIEKFYELVCKIRDKFPNSTFTTDYIVGFPTETEEDHIESMEWLKKIKFLDMHIFPYSKRKMTAASKLKCINSNIQKRRIKEITKLKNNIRKEILKSFINLETDVVFEKSESSSFQNGFSSEYIQVLVKTEENLTGQYKKVKIKKIMFDGLLGELI
ncbi:MAG: tRNA (N(6)-L-threonylcarbamoyladenosine(37)-C(2))-methylthiotransferase MtaB [Mycoplasmoidaceae bacterium]